jgi:hypothetical protein
MSKRLRQNQGWPRLHYRPPAARPIRRVVGSNAPAEIDVKPIRRKLGVSQARFAATFGFGLDAVQNWEQGRCRPEGAGPRLSQGHRPRAGRGEASGRGLTRTGLPDPRPLVSELRGSDRAHRGAAPTSTCTSAPRWWRSRATAPRASPRRSSASAPAARSMAARCAISSCSSAPSPTPPGSSTAPRSTPRALFSPASPE